MNFLQSLRFRLLVGAAVGIALALVAAGFFMVQNFASGLERERLTALDATLKRLVAQIDADAESPLGGDLPTDPRYEVPLSGVYWQVDDLSRGTMYRSRSLWDGKLVFDAKATGEPRLRQVAGPGDQTLLLLSRIVHVEGTDGTRTFRVSVAEARDDPNHPVRRFGNDLVAALTLVALFLFGAAWLQVDLGLRPLRKLRSDVEAVRQGASGRLPEDYASELQPVVQAVNNLLGSHESSVKFARERASDLAHGLKTPLAVLSATAERLRGSGDRANADIVEMLGEEMNERIEYQLRLSRLRVRSQSKGQRASLNAAVLRSVSVLRKTESGARLNWLVDLAEQIDVDVDEHDLMELVGVVLENAAKWAASRVDVIGRKAGENAELEIDDDGVGLTDEQIATLGARGRRLDQSRSGEGLGLSIVFEIARLNAGAIHIGRSKLGGLMVNVQLPLG